MKSVTLQTRNSEATFKDGRVDLLDCSTGGWVCRNARQRLLVRIANRVSEPIQLTFQQIRKEEGRDVVVISFESEDSLHRAELSVQPSENGLRFHADIESPEPVWLFEWTIDGLHLEKVIIPALGGQVLTDAMPAGESIAFKYPFWWNAQFVIGEASTYEGGVWLRTTDADPIFKLLRVGRSGEHGFSLTLGIEGKAPLKPGRLSGTWYLETFEGSWRRPVEIHRDWMAETFGLVPYQRHPHWPDWAGGLRLVFEVWGMRKDTGRPAHTFAQMEERVIALASRFPPEHTLLYLPGFAEGGIDSNIPDYNPSEKLGGRSGFRRLVDHAHELGYRVMIHTNVLGMAYSHHLFDDFAKYQVVDVFGRKQGWGMDLDGDWLAEPYFAYMNPGESAWTELMTSVLGQLIDDFELDAVFLDQTLLAFNVSSGPDFVTGMRRHIKALQRSFPDVLFAGEGLNDLVQPALPMAQIHGIDSVVGVHGMDASQPWREVHPVSSYLFGESTRFVAHLLTRHPTHPMFERQEHAYRTVGVVPALVCYDATQPIDLPDVDAVLERARSMAGQFHPINQT